MCRAVLAILERSRKLINSVGSTKWMLVGPVCQIDYINSDICRPSIQDHIYIALLEGIMSRRKIVFPRIPIYAEVAARLSEGILCWFPLLTALYLIGRGLWFEHHI